jgi:hypothetical protein
MKERDKETRKALEGIDHLKQSIIDILTTPIGSRVMRRDYGSRLFELVDIHFKTEGIKLVTLRKFNDLTGNRTRDLPACSIVPQQTLPKEETGEEKRQRG